MAQVMNGEVFAELTALAEPLVDKAREITLGQSYGWEGQTPEQRALEEEAQGLTMAFQSLANVSPLAPDVLMVALGGAVGALLAQCVGNHQDLTKLFHGQMKATYADVLRAAAPKGNA